MSATTFNPLGAARDFEAAGVERKQAEALRQAATADRGEFATKALLAVKPYRVLLRLSRQPRVRDRASRARQVLASFMQELRQ